jgi:hypothetical protein
MSLLLVLILLTVTILGGLALARMADAASAVSGNIASKEASIHASEVGWNVAYAQVKALPDEGSNAGGWYWSTMQPTDANGIPTTIDFNATPVVPGGVGRYTVTYAVERMCTVAAVTVPTRECLVKFDPTVVEDKSTEAYSYDPKNSRQFRITVRVTDPRGISTWTQALVNRDAL